MNLKDAEKQVKDWIVELVADKNGCKPGELIVPVIKRIHESLPKAGHEYLTNLVDHFIWELVTKEKRLIEIEYTLPRSSYRARSFLLPANTKINISA